MLKQQRVVIENIKPQIQCGAYFIKRVVGELVTVTADVLADGHDVIQAEVNYRHEGDTEFTTVRMEPLGNDFYGASFSVPKQGFYEYNVQGWVDNALNWQHGIKAKLKDGQHVKSELLDSVQYLGQVAKETLDDGEKSYLAHLVELFQQDASYHEAVEAAISKKLHRLFLQYPERNLANTSATLKVYVDRKKADFSTWYEFFPRSASQETKRHGTFKDCGLLLPKIASMGFDTLYFPPIHPIGETNRKGKNNATSASEGDMGVPWGIGSRYGGHKAIHPELGNEQDFKDLIGKAKEFGLEIAMDLAFQAAPDHPYTTSNPEWFRKRPDGTMQYAENPPKKYQDIVNFNFEGTAYKELWAELLGVALYWVEEFGIQVFRVDNPHTKPYYFWSWLISEVKKKHPDVLFLAEAFSRPKVMQQLAKQGFSQSYTYFTWRVEKHDLIDYMTELTQTEMRDYYRPNFWPNTPDINPYHLQGANETMHLIRYVLAATLCGNIGIYGPVFEYMMSDAMPGKEEYLNSEKYEIRHWDWSIKNKLIYLITKINEARHQRRSLQQTWNIRFCTIKNEYLIAFYKWDDERTDETLIIISLDSHHSQNGFVQLPMDFMGIEQGQALTMRDAITDNSYIWSTEWNYVEIHPALPFHLFHIKK